MDPDRHLRLVSGRHQKSKALHFVGAGLLSTQRQFNHLVFSIALDYLLPTSSASPPLRSIAAYLLCLSLSSNHPLLSSSPSPSTSRHGVNSPDTTCFAAADGQPLSLSALNKATTHNPTIQASIALRASWWLHLATR